MHEVLVLGTLGPSPLAIVERVTLTMKVDSAAWNRRVDAMAARIEGLVPVVKGNGYGFGREWLAERAAMLAPVMAVGTVFEVDSVPSNYSVIVLTPTLNVPDELRPNAVLTVGSLTHVEAAAVASGPGAQPRRVLVKIRSSMNRYGVTDVGDLVRSCRARHLDVVGVSIHPPLHGSFDDHRREIEALIADVDPALPIYLSHLDEESYGTLRSTHPHRSWNLRLGTSLWHADKSEISLSADVLDTRVVESEGVAGYRGLPVRRGQRLVAIGCGSAHGVVAHADGRSPFHFARQRLQLLEPPHMHTSMCIVDSSQVCPDVGDSVDVQRPLTTTAVDVIEWA